MSNGNDWSEGPDQPPEGGNDWGQATGENQDANLPAQQPPRTGGGAGGPHGGAGGSGGGGGGGGNDVAALLTEGWGGGELDSKLLAKNVKIALRRAIGPILYAWVGIALVVLLIDLMGSFFYIIGYYSDTGSVIEGTLAIRGIMALLETPAYFVVAALQFSLYRPMRRELFEGQGAGGGIKSLVQSASDVALPVLGTQLLVYLVCAIAGLCVVAPGLFAAFILSMSVYMVATRSLGPIDGMKTSITMVKKYWQTVAIAFAGIIAIGVAGGCIITVFELILGLVSNLLRPFGSVLQDVASWGVTTLGIFGLFVVWSGVFGTIDALESGDYVKE